MFLSHSLPTLATDHPTAQPSAAHRLPPSKDPNQFSLYDPHACLQPAPDQQPRPAPLQKRAAVPLQPLRFGLQKVASLLGRDHREPADRHRSGHL